MKALILAGGLGTRLRPLTYTRPKHLLPIANEPHIEHVFDLLLKSGITDVVLLTSYLAEAFEDVTAAAAHAGLKVEITHEQEPLGTAGALKNAEHLVGEDTFLAFNGDVLTDTDLGRLVDFHRDRGGEVTIGLMPVDDPSAFGVVPTDALGRVEGFIEKPPRGEAPTNLINAGIYVMEPAVLRRIPAGQVWSAEHRLFPEIALRGRMYARSIDAYWMDIGTREKYLRANLDALSGAYVTAAVEHPHPDAVLAADTASVDPGATLRAACLGAGTKVEAGASVAESVLLPGALVGAGARVERSVLGEGAEIVAGGRLVDGAVGDGERV